MLCWPHGLFAVQHVSMLAWLAIISQKKYILGSDLTTTKQSIHKSDTLLILLVLFCSFLVTMHKNMNLIKRKMTCTKFSHFLFSICSIDCNFMATFPFMLESGHLLTFGLDFWGDAALFSFKVGLFRILWKIHPDDEPGSERPSQDSRGKPCVFATVCLQIGNNNINYEKYFLFCFFYSACNLKRWWDMKPWDWWETWSSCVPTFGGLSVALPALQSAVRRQQKH